MNSYTAPGVKKEAPKSPFKTVKVEGKDVIMLVPELSDQLAIVDMETIRRLAVQYESAPFAEIKENFADKIMNSDNLEQMVQVAKKEVNFHLTVNLLKKYDKPIVLEADDESLHSKEEQGPQVAALGSRRNDMES